MLSPVVVGTLIQTGVVIILCVGFTFTYMVEKFPNFAHTAIATIGTILTFSMVRLFGLNPYWAWPASTLFCGLLGVGIYVFIVRPIKATGAREITLTFAFFAIAQIIGSLVSIYSYWFSRTQGGPASGFRVISEDFTLWGYPGVLIVVVPVCATLVVALYFFMTRMKHGIALRAVAEDEPLASSLGVNINRIHILNWFITGALAGLAGAIIPLWRYTGLGYSDEFLILVMAGSVIGGLHSVTGAVIGGLLAGVAQKALGALMILLFGVGAAEYEALYPMIFIVVILMLEPHGIMGIFENPHTPIKALRGKVASIRAYLNKVLHAA